jgi:hypothetical protein
MRRTSRARLGRWNREENHPFIWLKRKKGDMPRWLTRSVVVLRRVVGWGVLALLCLFFVALAINARDERPSSEALAMLQLPVNPYRPEENIYVALAGFEAPAGQSAVAAGQAKIAHYNDQVDAMFQNPLAPLVRFQALIAAADPLALKFKGKLDWGLPRELSFWRAARENPYKVDQLIEQNRELYQRYLALQELPGYFETERTSSAPDIVMPSVDIRNLFLAKFALEMQTGDEMRRQSALTLLRKDMDLWRRMLGGEGTLISKMLAVAYLQNDYLVFSDMIADPNTPIPDNIAVFLSEPTLSEWNIGKVFASEFRFHSFIYKQNEALSLAGWQSPDSSESGPWRWFNRVILNPIGRFLFKLKATENLDARLMNELAGFAAIDPTTFTAQRVRYKKWESENADFVRPGIVYNPIGKILVAIGAPAYTDYPLRPYDAAALQRLVRLSIEIRLRQIATSAIPTFMKQHPEWSTHPADGNSFSWNPSTSEIAVHTVAKQASDRRFSVQIWRNPS